MELVVDKYVNFVLWLFTKKSSVCSYRLRQSGSVNWGFLFFDL